MDIEGKLKQIKARYNQIGQQLAQPFSDQKEYAQLSKEHSDMTEVVEAISQLEEKRSQFAYNESLLQQVNNDPELKELKDLAEQEKHDLKHQIEELEQQVRILLLPKDSDDERNAIIELRAGTGGEEAALFAGVLLRMYQRYAEIRRWKCELMDVSEADMGGIREASMLISGKGVFARLKFESGVHRVQRVPLTEANGRIHTSTATVAVLPEVEDIDVKIEDKDLRIDVYRSSGPGGQSVNTTDSAVRITHIPTGIVVQQQDEKSQHKNKAKALKILRARIYEAERERKANERAAERKMQVGSGERSERIRTYNYPQGRVSDHRINLTLYNIEAVTNGSDLDDIIDPLIADYQAQLLSAER